MKKGRNCWIWMLLPLLCLVDVTSATGQELLYRIDPPSFAVGDGLGSGGDIDGDLKFDIVTSASTYGINSFSGSTGNFIAEIIDNPGGTNYGVRLTFAGDLNGDGHGDWLASGFYYTFPPKCYLPSESTARGGALVLSGADNSVLRSLSSANPNNHQDLFGYSSDVIGDLNGDGKGEILIGAPTELLAGCQVSGAGAVHVYSGATGSEIRTHSGTGIWVSGVGDVNADGKEDYALNDASNIRIYSGVTGSQLFSLPALETYGGSLRSLSDIVRRLGDVTADGIPDFAVGTEQSNQGPGFVRVISGANGSEVYRINGDSIGDCFGAEIARMSDLDGDGVIDFAVGAPHHSQTIIPPAPQPHGYVKIVSGRTGLTISRIDSPSIQSSRDYFGLTLAYMGDINNDGRPELAVGVPGEFTLGAIDVYSVNMTPPPSTATPVCTIYTAKRGVGPASLIPICRR